MLEAVGSNRHSEINPQRHQYLVKQIFKSTIYTRSYGLKASGVEYLRSHSAYGYYFLNGKASSSRK